MLERLLARSMDRRIELERKGQMQYVGETRSSPTSPSEWYQIYAVLKGMRAGTITCLDLAPS